MYEMEVAGVDFARLQAHLAERVVLPGDQGWDLARQAFTCCSTGALRRQLFALADAGFFVPVVVGPQFNQRPGTDGARGLVACAQVHSSSAPHAPPCRH
jgi:hypothetical protein